MITSSALLNRDPAHFLDFNSAEHPLALQLGGSEPNELAACARLADQWGFDEINLNIGCPSDRVRSGRFGACLMAEPQRVADCVAAMAETTNRPITVKHRTGIDDRDDYAALGCFVEQVAQAGCAAFIVHARKAWLHGLSPKENREIPPLQYAMVHRLKHDFPQVPIVINGGLKTLAQAEAQLNQVDGAMIGREAYQNPWVLADADARIFGQPNPATDRHQVVHRMLPYVAEQHRAGIPIHRITRHMLGLFQGRYGARAWRRYLSENASRPDCKPAVLVQALALLEQGNRPGANRARGQNVI